MADNTRILDKIKKLLALANSVNEHEAKLAAEQAQRLLVKHNLSMQSTAVGADGIIEETVGEASIYGNPHRRFILAILKNHFFVECILHTRAVGRTVDGRIKPATIVVLVGRDVNVKVATYIHVFLTRQFPKMWLAYKHANSASEKSRKSYYIGLYHGLNEQLTVAKKDVEQKEGLVLVADADLKAHLAQMDLKFKSAPREKSVNHDAMDAGREDGKNLKLHHAVAEQGERGLALKSGS